MRDSSNVNSADNITSRVTIDFGSKNTMGLQRKLNSNEAYITADAPLDALSTYQATINGIDNGTAFSRTRQFTTGN